MTSGAAAAMLGSCGCSKASRKDGACARASGIRKPHSARLNQPLREHLPPACEPDLP